MDKKKIIVFGAGRLFQSRKDIICEQYDVVAILDNNAGAKKREYPQYNIVDPTAITEFPELDIVIFSDLITEMIIQIANFLTREGCEKRLKLARLYVPMTERECIVAKENISVFVQAGKVFARIKEKSTVELIDGEDYVTKLYRIVSSFRDYMINAIIKMPLKPADSVFGTSRGKAIDRYYIEEFLERNKRFIYGRCLEIAENTYSKRYGEDRLEESVILHVEGWGENAIKGNLETGEGIKENQFDSMIITQTLMFIYDLNNTVKNIFYALKENGVALITVSGITKVARFDDDNWGMFHSFYMKGIKRLFSTVFGEENVEVIHYGNVKTAIAFLYGVTVEELDTEDFDYEDIDYPVIYGVIAHKREE